MTLIRDMTIDEMKTELNHDLYERDSHRWVTIRNQLWDALMLEWHGLVPYTGTAKPCPRRMIGKHCIAYGTRDLQRNDCLCYFSYPKIYDHFRMWRDKDTGELVLTGEPYIDPGSIIEEDVFKEFVSRCAEFGTSVTVSEKTPYGYIVDRHLGWLSLILIRKGKI